jgi:hypothetical protein
VLVQIAILPAVAGTAAGTAFAPGGARRVGPTGTVAVWATIPVWATVAIWAVPIWATIGAFGSTVMDTVRGTTPIGEAIPVRGALDVAVVGRLTPLALWVPLAVAGSFRFGRATARGWTITVGGVDIPVGVAVAV